MSTMIRTPTTPATQRSSPASARKSGFGEPQPSTPQAGTWKHPKFDEIARRQNVATFTDQNMRRLLWNGVGFVVLWYIGQTIWRTFPGYFFGEALFPMFASWTFRIIQLCLIFNIVVALRPFYTKRDNMEDIPLTPAQRKLLGLKPSSRPPTPGSEYVTPPRYRRTSTPLSSSPANRRGNPASGSPSGKRSESPHTQDGLESLINPLGPVYSPGASPLLQKTLMSGSGNRRSSYGSNPLGRSIGDPGTPSPLGVAKPSSVGLNNKWLYEKGRRNSGNTRLYT
ncbi:uncharacterized protein EAF01_000863 [Botrytis porri]|uniref:Nuclear pore complex component n=1 Tax=Botrytis porri TaxID=87229 RepID=A0A4Z1KEK7_9HELO|nr:uncharacterized protein EAF01_000863 [Botrytis porri]KAF7914457.1 hypothetical protein EAF01_000863 [Botrytis porri]TGO84487.1 hypothetical protein BPOR_0499g00030 [Botrytis porri]